MRPFLQVDTAPHLTHLAWLTEGAGFQQWPCAISAPAPCVHVPDGGPLPLTRAAYALLPLAGTVMSPSLAVSWGLSVAVPHHAPATSWVLGVAS